MSKMVCNICGSDHIVEYDYRGGTIFAECEMCNAHGDTAVFTHYENVFDTITTSPEVLAEKFVYLKGERIWRRRRRESVICRVWASLLTGDEYKSKAEAVVATIEKLKEVKDE